MKVFYRYWLSSLFAVLLGILWSGPAHADNIFVTNQGTNTIGEYTTSGATVNAALISGLDDPVGIAVSGSDVFVTNLVANTIGEYTTSGATVNASLISGLEGPRGIAIVSTTSVPEPITLLFLAPTLVGLAAMRRKFKK